ncbi:MAG: molybdopterin cofactor-binding domain-containing protein [Chloroflexales bacterium]
MSGSFRLILQSPPLAGQVVELTEPVVRVGRDPSNDVTVSAPDVARFHARLTQQDSGYAIEDLHSGGGTWINQTKVVGHVALTSGDTITLGASSTMIYQSAEATPAASVAPAQATSPAAAAVAQVATPTVAPRRRHMLGAPIKRVEDPEMLRGVARFTADIELPGMLHMAILRSDYAHARIRGIDTSAAEKLPGVVRVITAADIEGKIMPLPCIWIPGGAESHFPSHPFGVPGAGNVLATDRVRFIGDAVAVVVAATRYQAWDALDAIKVDYQPLPVVTDAEEALKPGAPQLHDEVPNNLNAYIPYGDKAGTELAISAAEVTVTLNSRNQRTINSPIEPRAAIGEYDQSTGEYILRASSQSPHDHRLLLALMILGIPFNKLRVIAPQIGGSFGTKGYIYPDMPLVLWLAKELGHPVKWVDTRKGMMRSTVQGRDQMMYATLGGTRDGKITALRCTSYANLGAYPSTIGPGVATAMVGRSVTSVYDIEHAFCEVYAAFSNLVPLGAQRGSGRAEATFLIERLVDLFARKIGMDPAEVRRKNLIRPEQFPFDNRMGWKYDSGDYPAALETVLAQIGYDQIPAAKAEARKRGKRLGVGLAPFVAISGVGPSPRMSKEGMLGGTWESANIKVHPTGEVSVIIGSKSHGQSHETTFAQIVAEVLGIEVKLIEILHSDTKRAPFGQGSYGSRSFSVGGAAVYKASQILKEKVILQAAHMLKVPVEEIVYAGGKASVKGQPERVQTLQEISLALWYAWDIPAGMEPSLDVTTYLDPPDFNFPYGCHAAVVEIDERTGQVEIRRFVGLHDSGVVGNEMVFDGQMQGGIAHGIGQVLYEQARYAKNGQLLTSSLTEYPLPRSTQVPNVELLRTETPTPHTELGAKGAGELGSIGAPAAIANAICDALSDLGIEHIEMPITPEKVWRAIRDAQAAA